jgi:hypothetical protein
MAKKDTSDSSKQPRARKTRKTSAEPVPAMPLAASLESVSYAPSDEDIARKAYALWESRGRPLGSPDEDWYRARQELTASAKSNGAHA